MIDWENSGPAATDLLSDDDVRIQCAANRSVPVDVEASAALWRGAGVVPDVERRTRTGQHAGQSGTVSGEHIRRIRKRHRVAICATQLRALKCSAQLREL